MKKIYMDIHTHILPGIDDGSDSFEQTMEMISQAYDEGIRVIIATPHYNAADHKFNNRNNIIVLNRVREEAKKKFPEMRIFLGSEVYYSPGIVEDIKSEKASFLGTSKYVLVEFSTLVDENTIRRAIEEFTFAGCYPIIAHIERYKCLEKKIDMIRELVSSGACLQVNCRSLLKGKRKKWSRRLLDEGLVHFIASDCHDSEKRKPIFNSSVEFMLKRIGEKRTEKIVKTNILCIIRNEVLQDVK